MDGRLKAHRFEFNNFQRVISFRYKNIQIQTASEEPLRYWSILRYYPDQYKLVHPTKGNQIYRTFTEQPLLPNTKMG